MVVSITCSHSSWLRVGVSPVVPQGTRKSIPDSTCHATRLRSAASSTEPSWWKGVTKAVPQPRNCMTIRYRHQAANAPCDYCCLQLPPDVAKVKKTLLAG